MTTNLEKILVAWLEGRGRWLRAGNDALPRYLSTQMHCGPNRLQELTELLRTAPASLYVEQTGTGKITLVGLAIWQQQDDIATDHVPEDLASAWQLIAKLYTQLALQAVAAGDHEAALELASEAEGSLQAVHHELAEWKAHECSPPATQASPCSCEAKIAELQSKYQSQQSVNENLRESLRIRTAELKRTRRSLSATRQKAMRGHEPHEACSELMELLAPFLGEGVPHSHIRLEAISR